MFVCFISEASLVQQPTSRIGDRHIVGIGYSSALDELKAKKTNTQHHYLVSGDRTNLSFSAPRSTGEQKVDEIAAIPVKAPEPFHRKGELIL